MVTINDETFAAFDTRRNEEVEAHFYIYAQTKCNDERPSHSHFIRERLWCNNVQNLFARRFIHQKRCVLSSEEEKRLGCSFVIILRDIQNALYCIFRNYYFSLSLSLSLSSLSSFIRSYSGLLNIRTRILVIPAIPQKFVRILSYGSHHSSWLTYMLSAGCHRISSCAV